MFAIGVVVVLALVLQSGTSGSASPLPGPAPRACPSGYPIKGNVTQSGSGTSRIYHLPAGNFYAVTNPETCFATEADAKAAGFRPSLN